MSTKHSAVRPPNKISAGEAKARYFIRTTNKISGTFLDSHVQFFVWTKNKGLMVKMKHEHLRSSDYTLPELLEKDGWREDGIREVNEEEALNNNL